MTTRTIILRLTEAQYDALASAVSIAEGEWGEFLPDRHFRGRLQALDGAWSKIRDGWHDRARDRVKRSASLDLAPEAIPQDRSVLR